MRKNNHSYLANEKVGKLIGNSFHACIRYSYVGESSNYYL